MLIFRSAPCQAKQAKTLADFEEGIQKLEAELAKPDGCFKAQLAGTGWLGHVGSNQSNRIALARPA